jgi:SAM-dependent methyltransferase
MDGLKLLHIGAGGDSKKGFINSDKTLVWKGKKRQLDDVFELGGLWPYESDSIDGIVSMHVLQQLSWRELAFFALPEALRVLKKGGVMRFGCPMVEIEDKNLEWLLGWNNINLFHEDLLRRVFERVGFSSFTECEYGKSVLPILAKLDNRKDRGTRYYEVIK